MLGIHDLWFFIVSGLLLNITPGSDTAFIVGRSAQLGWRGGAIAVIGICCGCLVHVLACALGLSALVAASSTAFSFIKWVGAAYLCFIGISMLLSRSSSRARLEDAAIESDTTPLRRVFWQGALTNLLNPKVALFFLAFLPQFVAADSPHKGWAFLVLGLTFIFNGLLWCLGVAAARRERRAGSGDPAARCSGLIARSAGCSSISVLASRCFRQGEARRSRSSPRGLVNNRLNCSAFSSASCTRGSPAAVMRLHGASCCSGEM